MPYMRKKTWIQLAPRSLSREVVYGPAGRGMGQTDTGSPWYNAGLAAGAGGTPGVDLSQGFPTAEAQAAFVAGFNASSALSQAPGLPQPGVPVTGGTTAPSSSIGDWIAANQTTVLVAGISLFGVLFLSKLFK